MYAIRSYYAPRVEGGSEDLELLLPPPHAHAADQPASGERVDAGEHLGHHHGMAMTQDEDGGAETRAHGRVV